MFVFGLSTFYVISASFLANPKPNELKKYRIAFNRDPSDT